MDRNNGGNLLSLLPAIRRCRGHRLYAENGKRFLDLWQDDGRGVLGAKGTGIGTVVKAETDKGLGSPLPNVYERRLEKALAAAFPLYAASRFYPDEAAAARALASCAAAAGAVSAGAATGTAAAASAARSGAARSGAAMLDGTNWYLCIEELAFDPARREASTAGRLALLERPYPEGLDMDAARNSFHIAFLRLPLARAFSPAVLLFRDEADAAGFGRSLVPPLELSAAVKAFAELAGHRNAYAEELWKRTDRRLGGLFERKGPRLWPRCPREAYPALFKASLERGVLLSPFWDLPSNIPADFDDGELKTLSDIVI